MKKPKGINREFSFIGILMPTPDNPKQVYNRIHLGCGILMDVIYDKNGKCLNDFNFV